MNKDLDPRTTHLLPPAKKPAENPQNWYNALRLASALPVPAANDRVLITPTPQQVKEITNNSFIGPKLPHTSQSRTRRNRTLLSVRGGTSHSSSSNRVWYKRYGAILLDKEGKRHFGKIITQLDSIEEWAKQNGYTVERSMRFYGYIDENQEKTEITD